RDAPPGGRAADWSRSGSKDSEPMTIDVTVHRLIPLPQHDVARCAMDFRHHLEHRLSGFGAAESVCHS
ncbi:MAG: hypothetical protein ACRD0W_06335, partial [Acidimicrobiales bacterium]